MTTDPKPSGPDPEAVRKALAEIDEARREYHRGDETYNGFVYRAALQLPHLEAAARAWLAQQDGESE